MNMNRQIHFVQFRGSRGDEDLTSPFSFSPASFLRSSLNARATKRRAFTLIQLIGTLALIAAMVSIILISIKTVSDRANDASNARRQSLAPALQVIDDARGSISNHNTMARQADHALKSIQ